MGNITTLEKHIKELKQANHEKLQEEYEKLVQNLRRVEQERTEEHAWASPVLPDAILRESIPGTIRTAEHFMIFMRRVVEYLKVQYYLKLRFWLNIIHLNID